MTGQPSSPAGSNAAGEGKAANSKAANGDKAQRWDLDVDGRTHRVEIEGSVSRTTSWFVDDELVGQKKSTDDRVQLEPATAGPEAVVVKFDGLGRARRVTLYLDDDSSTAKAQALLGSGGIDFDPEVGSWAALRQQRIREHPRRHAMVALVVGAAKVGVPLLLGLLVVRFVVNLPWPDWQIPWPDIDLPSIPWPDINLPSIPWPDINLPDWQLPSWVRWVLDHVKYVWPILLAAALAKAEINRQRKQDALKAELKARGKTGSNAQDTAQQNADG